MYLKDLAILQSYTTGFRYRQKFGIMDNTQEDDNLKLFK